MEYLSFIVKTLGLLAIANFSSSLVTLLQDLVFTSNLQKYRHGADSWALVTGSSGGIGFELARGLCRRGFNVFVHGRSREKLDLALSSLRLEFPDLKFESILIDASRPIDKAQDILPAGTRWGHLTVLINNVGTGHDPANDFTAFTSQSTAKIDHVLNVNIRFMTHLTHLLLPHLEAHSSPSQPCLVINASSLADIGLPWISVYSATKAYVTTFSRALDTELKGENANVDVLASIIGDTDTPGHRVGTSVLTPSAEDMARMILNRVGRGTVTTPYIIHQLQQWLCDVQPFWLLQKGLIANLKPNAKKRS